VTQARFTGSVVTITGAARGLGYRAAQLFAAEGARFVLSDLDKEALEAGAAQLRVTGAEVVTIAGDISQEEVAALIVGAGLSRFGRVDVAINNAGIAHPFRKLADLDGATMERLFHVNVMGVFYGLKHQIPVMERQFAQDGRGGVILNVASVAGIVGAPLLSAYAASKHAVVGLTRSAAAETARKGVRINALCPAFTNTQMVSDAMRNMQGEPDEALARVVSSVPMRRLAEPDEIAQAMLWICSPENGFMTGHALALDGGLSAV
jgi:NAD(P)-dependent dehydrogenase (short-subunit alcohol dehydrogenase family)